MELDVPLARTDPPAEQSLLPRLRMRLTARLATDPSLGSIARELGVGARTLQRQLSALGSSFQNELEGTRRSRALHLLRDTGDRVESVAAELGYRDASNFRRAFRRWTGVSPTTFRMRGAQDPRVEIPIPSMDSGH